MDILGFIIILVKVLVVFAGTMLTVLIMIYAERRVSAFIQGRLGPNRVGPQGIFQPLADGIKFLMKGTSFLQVLINPFLSLLRPSCSSPL